jgi:histidine ammonia-lyase
MNKDQSNKLLSRITFITGLGDFLSPPQTRAILAVRLASLCCGFSGVTVELLESLERL